MAWSTAWRFRKFTRNSSRHKFCCKVFQLRCRTDIWHHNVVGSHTTIYMHVAASLPSWVLILERFFAFTYPRLSLIPLSVCGYFNLIHFSLRMMPNFNWIVCSVGIGCIRRKWALQRYQRELKPFPYSDIVGKRLINFLAHMASDYASHNSRFAQITGIYTGASTSSSSPSNSFPNVDLTLKLQRIIAYWLDYICSQVFFNTNLGFTKPIVCVWDVVDSLGCRK